MNPARRKAWIAGIAMAGTALAAAWARPHRQAAEFGEHVSLEHMFPTDLPGWQLDRSIVPVPPSPEQQQVVARTYDQTLARTYRNAHGYRVMLSVAYGGRQNEGMNTHRPEICYPAQGLSVRKDTWRAELDLPQRRLPVHRLVAGNDMRNEPITYWLVVGRGVADFGLSHKLATLKYGLTGRIPDGMLVRVSSVDADEERSFAMQDAFLRELLAGMAAGDRERVLGVL